MAGGGGKRGGGKKKRERRRTVKDKRLSINRSIGPSEAVCLITQSFLFTMLKILIFFCFGITSDKEKMRTKLWDTKGIKEAYRSYL